MQSFIISAWLAWIVPLVGSLLVPVAGKLGPKARDYFAIVPPLLAALLATSLLPQLLSGASVDSQVPWFSNITAGVLVDPLSIIISIAVSWVSFLIMVYSLDYMKGEEGLTRYWFFMNFFIGSMLLIVLSDNLLQLFFGWEGVGLCSYALIGFYYRDEKDKWVGREGDVVAGVPHAYSPTHAGLKAFITTRTGDVFTLSSIFIIFYASGTFNFHALAANTSWATLLHDKGLLLPTMLLILGGAFGKSAQFPFQEWLPDAMAGPTPVSALIHAATMVKAGVFLVARIAPIFFLLGFPEVKVFFIFLAMIGGITAFLAAAQGMVNKEIKKVLAYSTVSQIGYMMLALGVAGLTPSFVAAYSAGIFQLLAHMMFKAGLFMGAGVVIHMTGSFSMDGMGGLRKIAGKTFTVFLILALALAGFPPLSGFFSKDAIFASMLAAPSSSAVYIVYILASVTAVLTAFYSMRMVGLTFFGEEHNVEHKDAGFRQFLTYALLAAGTVLVGLLAPLFEDFLNGSLSFSLISFGLSVKAELFEISPFAITTSLTVMALGILVAYPFYISRSRNVVNAVGSGWLRSVHTFLWDRIYLNAIMYRIFVYPVLSGAEALNRFVELSFFQNTNRSFFGGSVAVATVGDWLDRNVVDGFMIGTGKLFAYFSRLLRKLQSGNAESYLFGIVIGLLIILLLLYHFVGVL
ncbi:MAG: NADH-quinone oxidoreductase subunit L [Nitrososphaerota archaeon]|jgi:NADH-quinone oxidoreductase subunit L|nr:NADH-quinone oxidoreductase subunit L [Nitrososphaerota archaeon]